MALRTGLQYRKSLRDGRQVIYDGAIVNVLRHARFRRGVNLVAQFYDFQNRPEQADIMSFETPEGDRVGMAFLEAASKDDLHRKARAYAAWAHVTCGTMGRSPDYMNTCIASIYGARHKLAQIDAQLARRAKSLYFDLRAKDLCLTHTFGQHTQRRPFKVVSKSKRGVTVSGARGIASLAPFANCSLNLDIGVVDGAHYSFCFVYPISRPGLRWICREFVAPDSPESVSPLASRADEMDCVPIFKSCTIPDKGLFGFFRSDEASAILQRYEPLFVANLQHHVLIRSIHKTRFLLGLAHLMAQCSGGAKTAQIKTQLGEIIHSLLILQALSFAAVEHALHDPDTGAFHPNPEYTFCGIAFSGELHSKIVRCIADIAPSRLLSIPHQSTFDVFGAAVEAHYRGDNIDGAKTSALFRLAWDVTGSEWAARQVLYERFHFGPADAHRASSYRLFDKTESIAMVERLLKKRNSSNEVFPTS